MRNLSSISSILSSVGRMVILKRVDTREWTPHLHYYVPGPTSWAVCVPEVEVLAGVSAKATPWHTDNPCLFHHLKAVEQVQLHACSLRDESIPLTHRQPPHCRACGPVLLTCASDSAADGTVMLG